MGGSLQTGKRTRERSVLHQRGRGSGRDLSSPDKLLRASGHAVPDLIPSRHVVSLRSFSGSSLANFSLTFLFCVCVCVCSCKTRCGHDTLKLKVRHVILACAVLMVVSLNASEGNVELARCWGSYRQHRRFNRVLNRRVVDPHIGQPLQQLQVIFELL